MYQFSYNFQIIFILHKIIFIHIKIDKIFNINKY